jgi:hypothetical protein
MNRITKLLFCFLFFASCTQESDVATSTGLKPFFDLKAFFKEETIRLQAQTGKVKKIVKTNGKQEERVLDGIDFKRELEMFANSDINRPAWSGNYSVDSVYNDSKELVGLHYSANDDDLRTQKIEIGFAGSVVTKVFIENKMNSSIASSTQVLDYQPKEGYSIESHQQVRTAGEQLFKIEVQFLK